VNQCASGCGLLGGCCFNFTVFLPTRDVSVVHCLQGRVVMGTQAVSPYQQVIEKTKNLAFRSQMLVMNIEKKLATKDQEVICFLD